MFINNVFVNKSIKIDVPKIRDGELENFLGRVSRCYVKLRGTLSKEHIVDEKYAYRYSSLREFPIVEFDVDGDYYLFCPIPTLLFWRVTDGLYYDLMNHKGFSNLFGKSFQRYVGEIVDKRLGSGELLFQGEAEYFVGGNRKDSVDWMVSDGDLTNMFVECKTKRMTWNTKAEILQEGDIQKDLQFLSEAVVQVYKFIGDYIYGKYDKKNHTDENIYPLIVTMEDWFIFGYDIPVRLRESITNLVEEQGIEKEFLEKYPYFIMSVEEFSEMLGVIKNVGLEKFWSDKLSDKEKKEWNMDGYCRTVYPDVLKELDDIFYNDVDEAINKMIENVS